MKTYGLEDPALQRHFMREYLQYMILDALFKSKIGSKIVFLGGTSVRIVRGGTRFSEDLDFDNLGFKYEEFIAASEEVKRFLEKVGFEVEIRNIKKAAYHCHIKFPKLLYEQGLSPLESEKILIQVDTMAQGFKYKAERNLLQKFDIYTEIFTVPIDPLLSQKILTIFARKRKKGRDFFDVSFLLGKTKPNMKYLEEKLGIKSQEELREKIIEIAQGLDLKKLSLDVEPFLIKKSDVLRVTTFVEMIKQYEF